MRVRGGLAVLTVLVAVASGIAPDDARSASPPNVVVVMIDDQEAASIEAMPQVRRHLKRNGTAFTNFFATLPLCCPSRATFLTGQYAHNHGLVLNNPGF